jgi:hypothetical protein
MLHGDRAPGAAAQGTILLSQKAAGVARTRTEPYDIEGDPSAGPTTITLRQSRRMFRTNIKRHF